VIGFSKFSLEEKRVKPVKHVRFKGLPPIEEEENKQRKGLPKDAPKGAEDSHLDDDDFTVADQERQ